MSEHVLRDGTSQWERRPTALQPGYIHLDELTFEQLLAMAVDYAPLLHFHNLKDVPEPARDGERGVWESLFLGDEAAVIAQILTTDLASFEADFRDFLTAFRHRADPGTWLPGYPPAHLPSYRLARRLDAWFDRLRAMEGAVAASLSRQLAGLIIPGLMYELTDLASYLGRFDKAIPELFRADFKGFWFARPARVKGERKPAYPEEEGADAEPFLRSNFHAFYKATVLLRGAAATALATSLKSREHSPAVGLYMAFLGLYRKVQGTMNEFTARHMDFYYRDVLRLEPRPASADSTYLLLVQDGNTRHVRVAKGTAFPAGVDEQKQEVIFTSDSDVLVGKTRVGALCTLHFQHNPLISPEREFGLATAGKASIIRPADPTGEDGSLQAWPLLGAPKQHAQRDASRDATLGFALASPVLLLQEGFRDITLAFDLQLEPEAKARHSPRNESLGEWLRRLAEVTETKELDAFFKTFREMFRISLTTEGGWYEVKEYLPLSLGAEGDRVGDGLGIQIQLPPDAAAVTPYVPTIHGEGYATAFPVIRFILNPASYLYPYSLLTRLTVRQIDIEVVVRGARNLLVHNSLGQLDAQTPFTPFGPAPVLGAYFQVGAAETAQKRLTDLEIDLEWGGLPSAMGGFAEHYAGYGKTYDNADFEVSITTLKGGKWLPGEAAEQPRCRLFAPPDGEGRPVDREAIAPHRRLSCQAVVALSQPCERLLGGEEFAYTPQTKNGFFRFTLSAPEQAFGHRDYPLLLTGVLTENARLRKARLLKPVPQPPYTPVITSLSLNYRASASLHMDHANLVEDSGKHEKMFHIHPFGTERVSPRTHRRVTLVPGYDAPGNLFIGLAGDDPSGPLTLLFHLREDSTPGREVQPSDVHWSYLSAQGWRALEKTRVRADGTRGFLSTGIVELDLPPDFSRGHTVMPSELSWLRVSVARHPEALCSAYGIHAQALRVSRRLDQLSPSGRGASPASPVPAKRIKMARTSIPGIVQISQPLPSGGGRPEEDLQQFVTRAGERLRHKSRATLPWDYERLILERYPGIYKVKCFPNLAADPDPAKRTRPGDLLIVVVPQLQPGATSHMQPLADRLLLKDIRAFVQGLASPFARIEVRNPDYELIQIRCSVVCTTRASGDHVIALNQAISAYLSPWEPTGYQTCFGWRIRGYDLESYIQELPYVDYVTGFSMLRVAQRLGDGDGDRYLLDDTVPPTGEPLREFDPVYPWSIAIPFQQHHIETTDRPTSRPSRRTGVGELEIGATLIIS